MTAESLMALLRSYRFIYSSEKELQDGVAAALTNAGVPFEREKCLGEQGDIDFAIGTIGLEVKIKGSPSEVARQLIRYCGSPSISELILFTGKARLGLLPPALLGKKIHVVTLWRTFL